jgi:FAD-dependent oxidoreductase domain-containing protein 1
MKIEIIGGGIIGSSIAYHLSQHPGVEITVFEKDTSYQLASFARSCGGIRNQFSCETNIRMGLHGSDFIRNETSVSFTGNGYLMLFGEHQSDDHDSSIELQKQCGSSVVSMDPAQLVKQFPWINTDDIYRGVWTSDGTEGWIDPYELHTWYRTGAKDNGVQFVKCDGVTAITTDVDEIVLAAGCWTSEVAKAFGIDVPGAGHKHTVFNILTEHPVISDMPLIADLITGAYIRPEGKGYITGHDGNGQWNADDLDPNWDHWEQHWMDLYHRSPDLFEAIKTEGAWAGWYDTSLIDDNAIIDTVGNYHVATGFTGRGLMQSPAVGLVISERILGLSPSFDIASFALDRIPNNEKYVI